MKPYFDLETSAKTPKTAISSNKSSKSPLVQRVHNPEVQKTEYGNSISCHKEDNGLYICPSTSSYAERFKRANLEENPVLEDPTYNKYKAGQKALENLKQRKNEFGSVYQQKNEPHQGSSQLISEQSVAANVIEPGNISDFRSGFTNPFLQERVNAFGYMINDPVVYYPKLQNLYALYGPHPIITNLHSNTRVEIYPQNLNLLPNGLQHTVDLSNPMRSAMTKNKKMELHGQNKHPSTDLVAKTETQSDIRGNFSSSPHSNFWKTFTQGTQQIHTERSTLKYPENSMNQTEVMNTSNKRTQQKNAQQKNARKKQEKKHKQLKKAEKFAQYKQADKITEEKHLKQENSNVFTGKGYESIEDFIKALKNGTLYKRY